VFKASLYIFTNSSGIKINPFSIIYYSVKYKYANQSILYAIKNIRKDSQPKSADSYDCISVNPRKTNRKSTSIKSMLQN